MSLSRTLHSAGSVKGPLNYTTSAFTPANNSLLVLLFGVVTHDSAYVGNDITVTDSLSSTWTKRVHEFKPSGGFRAFIQIWTTEITTGASMTISLATAYTTWDHRHTQIISYTGHNGVGETVKNTISSYGTYALTFGTAPNASSEILAARLLVPSDSALYTATPASGWTEIDDHGTAGWGSFQSQAGNDGVDVDWAQIGLPSTGGIHWGGAGAVEILAAATGGNAQKSTRTSVSIGVHL